MRGRPYAKNHRSDGFSLVEALVALTIFATGAAVLLQLAPRATQFATRGRLLSEATGLAQAKIEELRKLSPSDPWLQDGTHHDPQNPLRGHFDRRWDVTTNDPIEGMRRLEVRVGFRTSNADSIASLITYF